MSNIRFFVRPLSGAAVGVMTVAVLAMGTLAAEPEKGLAEAAADVCAKDAAASGPCTVVATRQKFVLADLVAADFGDNDEPAR